MTAKQTTDLGSGLSSSGESHPFGAPQNGLERVFAAGSTFLSGMLSASQLLGAPLKIIDPAAYENYVAFSKQSFGVLITTMTQWWSPTVVRVSGDKSIPKQLVRKPDGTLECKFPQRLVMMANHQIYVDWLYLWWIGYTNNAHGFIYIILKESLKNVPIVGWGAQFYNFIFLSRNWTRDQKRFASKLDQLSNTKPMWLFIFPEGTNLAPDTRDKSKAWAEKNNIEDMKHQLLPRSKGLQLSLQRLKDTTEWLYDCTIGYEGIPPGGYGQDIFTLQSCLFEGRPPKSVNMHFRRFKIAAIPIHNDKAFDLWLRNRWREKDYLLEHFARFNRFPDDDKWMLREPNKARPAKFIETQIKSKNTEEFLSIFAPLTSTMMLLSTAYGANPQDLMQMLTATGNGQLKLLQNGLTTDNLQKLQSRVGPGRSIGEAAQRDLIQKYLSSIAPTVPKPIDFNRSISTRSVSGQSLSSGSTSKKKVQPRPLVKAGPAPAAARSGRLKAQTNPRKVTIDPKMLAKMKADRTGSDL